MPTLATLSRLTDLALGTPNIGSVNFAVLHTLIHSILDKLEIGNAKAEIQEEDHEFLRRHLVDNEQLPKTSNTDLEKSKSDNNLKTGAKDGKTTRPGSVPYHQLEDRVVQLEKHWKDLNSLPANSELFERVREKDAKPRPVSEMWQTMKLSKNVDANAQGLSKLMSMFEDILEDTKMLKENNNELAKKLATEQASSKDVDNLKEQIENLKKTMNHMGDRMDEFPGDDFFDSLPTWAALEAYFKGLKERLDKTIEEKSQAQAKSQAQSQAQARRRSSSRPPIPGPTPTLQSILEQLGILNTLHNDLVARVDKLESTLGKNFETKMSSLEEAIAGDRKELQKLAAAADRLICRIQGIEDQICCLRQVINRLRGSDADTCGILTTDDEIACLRNLVNKLQCEVDMLRCFGQGVSVPASSGPVASGHALPGGQNGAKGCGNSLSCGPNGNKGGYNAFCCPPPHLESEIQNLFCIVNELDVNKMDKCQMMEELNQKADRHELDDKVSQICFDMACEGLHTVINDILQKLLDSGDVVRNITCGLESKLEREELDGFKEQLEAKLRCLAKRLVTLQRKCEGCEDTNDAAGTRRPLLTKQHCLSCDRVIRMTPKEAVPSIPAAPGLPMGKVMKNYTKYELDQLKTLALCQGQVTSKPIDSDPFSVFRNCGGRSRSPPRQCPTPSIDCEETPDSLLACRSGLGAAPEAPQEQAVPVSKMKVTGGYTPYPPNPCVRPQSAMVARPTETPRTNRPASACHPSTSAQNCKARTAPGSVAPQSPKTDLNAFVLNAKNTLERSLARNNTEQCKGKGRLNGNKPNSAVQKSDLPCRPRYASGRPSVHAGVFQRGKPGGRDHPTNELARPCASYGRKPIATNTNTSPGGRFDGTEEEEEEGEECQ